LLPQQIRLMVCNCVPLAEAKAIADTVIAEHRTQLLCPAKLFSFKCQCDRKKKSRYQKFSWKNSTEHLQPCSNVDTRGFILKRQLVWNSWPAQLFCCRKISRRLVAPTPFQKILHLPLIAMRACARGQVLPLVAARMPWVERCPPHQRRLQLLVSKLLLGSFCCRSALQTQASTESDVHELPRRLLSGRTKV